MRSGPILCFICLLALAGCGGNVNSSPRDALKPASGLVQGAQAPAQSPSSTFPRATSAQTISAKDQFPPPTTEAVASAERPSRPPRQPNGTPALWAKDVRVNTLVANHGVGTSGEPGIALVADGLGGMFLAWEDSTAGVIRTQRLDASGSPLWPGGQVIMSGTYQASPSAVTDGRGGALVAWVDGRNGNCDSTTQMNCSIYIQRIDASGSRLWGDSALLVAAWASYPLWNRFAMISDGAQGAFLAWSSGPSYYNCCSFYMQHIGPDGQPLWPASGIRVSELPAINTGPAVTGARLVSDGRGGAIVAWWNQQFVDGSVHLMTQRVDCAGELLWDQRGVEVTFAGSGQANFDAVSDGAGGVILAIQANDVAKSSNTHLYLQRVSDSGQVMWSNSGVMVSADVGAQITPALVGDGNGGAFVAWSLWDLQSRSNNRVAVEHVDGAGNLLWNGPTQVTATSKGQNNPHLLSDHNGGVMVAWEDCRSTATDSDCVANYDLYAQRIGGTGKRVWAAEGFGVSTAKSNQGIDYGSEKRPGFEMVSDDNGGVMLAWPDGRLKACSSSAMGSCELYAQHLAP